MNQQRILGQIDYKEISLNEALIDIYVYLEADQFKELMRQNKEQNYVFIIVDKSGSMSSVIDQVQSCTKKCVQQYFASRKRPNAPNLIMFDNRNYMTNENNLEAQIRFLEANCVAGGGTNFTEPLNEILKFIYSKPVKELYVLFLTDGQDGSRSSTIELSKTIKDALHQKNIYSWFNVIGLGEGHDAAFLGSLADIGTERGQFVYMTNQEIQSHDLKKLDDFYDSSLFKEDKQQGVTVSLPDGSQVFCSVESDQGGQVKLSKYGVHIENKNLKQFFQDVTKNQEIQFKIKQNEHKGTRDEAILIESKIRKLNFDQQPQDLEKQVTSIQEEVKQKIDSVFDEFLRDELNEIRQKLNQIQQVNEESKKSGRINTHNRALLEIAKNDILAQQERNSNDVKVSSPKIVDWEDEKQNETEFDNKAQSTAGYLQYAVKKKGMKYFRAKAIGTAIRVLDAAIEKFKGNLNKGNQQDQNGRWKYPLYEVVSEETSMKKTVEQNKDMKIVTIKIKKTVQEKPQPPRPTPPYPQPPRPTPPNPQPDPALLTYVYVKFDITMQSQGEDWDSKKVLEALQKMRPGFKNRYIAKNSNQVQVFEQTLSSFDQRGSFKMIEKTEHNNIDEQSRYRGRIVAFSVERI